MEQVKHRCRRAKAQAIMDDWLRCRVAAHYHGDLLAAQRCQRLDRWVCLFLPN